MKISVRDMVLISLFAALTGVGAWCTIPLPTPVPFTLQFLFCAYSGLLLGSKKGMLAQIVYVCMGLAGIPVFSGGKGGFNYIVEPTFGYLIGFIVCAYVIGKLTENMGKVNVFRLLISVMAGLAIVYVLGAAYLYLMQNVYLGKVFTIKSAIISGIVPFVLWDAIKGVVAVVTSVSVIPRLRKLGYMENKKFAEN